MSILELSGNFGNLKILRFAIQKWYQKSAVAAVRKQFAVRHSAHASCKRFLGMYVHYLLFIFFNFLYLRNKQIFSFSMYLLPFTVHLYFLFRITNLTNQLNIITAFLIINRPFKSKEKKKERKKIELFICKLLRIP